MTSLTHAIAALRRWHLRHRWRHLSECAHALAQRIGEDAAHLVDLLNERDAVRRRLDAATMAAERTAMQRELAP